MGNEKKSQASDANADPAAQERSADPASPPPSEETTDGGGGNSLEATLARAEATLTLLTAWLANIQKLFQLELDRTLTAGKRIIALQLILLPLGAAVVVSLCGGVGLIAYYFLQSIYFAFLVFLLAQIGILLGIFIYQKQLVPLLGFEETKRQVKEALNDVAETFK
ncbi:hypothetical protein MO867_02490 [Microbulbifer sp. OS29]|uniref:Holin-X, holin superfamily III n=1 Tax=Microbulbifer okhotskensis TaxID=2926617 RepID=A0A9X2EJ40_9GAMM|nr:hypothetical protein [Microbulbifer okhotskensis]MCO1333199.1 hypothetical protein [Microbulbifer okhotskensis]